MKSNFEIALQEIEQEIEIEIAEESYNKPITLVSGVNRQSTAYSYYNNELPSTTEFLYRLLTKFTKEYITIDKFGKTITAYDKRRSVSELYVIMQSYYPEYNLITYLKDILNIIKQVNIEQGQSKCTYGIHIALHWCPNIKKSIFYYNKTGYAQESIGSLHLFDNGEKYICCISYGKVWEESAIIKYFNDAEFVQHLLKI